MGKGKGDRRENQARKLLEEAGFTVETPNFYRYGNKDFWNLFDSMAGRGDEIRFVQVKSNSTDGCLKEIKNNAAFLPYMTDAVNIEVWICHDKEGWRIQRLTSAGWVVILDERDKDCNMGEHVTNNI